MCAVTKLIEVFRTTTCVITTEPSDPGGRGGGISRILEDTLCLFQSGVAIMPTTTTTYPPQIFRLSYGPVLNLLNQFK